MNGRRRQIGKGSFGVVRHDEWAQKANWQKVLVVDKASHYAKPDVSIEGHRYPSIDTLGLTHVIHMLRLAGAPFRPVSPRIGAPTSRSAGSILIWMLSEAATPSVIGSTNRA